MIPGAGSDDTAAALLGESSNQFSPPRTLNALVDMILVLTRCPGPFLRKATDAAAEVDDHVTDPLPRSADIARLSTLPLLRFSSDFAEFGHHEFHGLRGFFFHKQSLNSQRPRDSQPFNVDLRRQTKRSA